MSDGKFSGRDVQTPTDSAAVRSGASESSSSSAPSSRQACEQPTIISNHPPMYAENMSDSAYRIMEGRIMPGDHLGHFELIEYVGGGGMGKVFRAFDTRLARTVALKILPPAQASDPETLQRFQNEAQSAARLDHENIARVHYVGEDRGIHFIVFEFVEGENIRKLVERKGPLPLDEVVSYTLQVAEALSHANARHVVHRDIKPSNLLIAPSGRVKLIDMGLARQRHADPIGDDLTASGVTLGTFDYISPEQARDPRNTDIRSDIYSLGCTMYFMLTGQPPFPQGTVLQKLLQHHGDQPPDVRQLRGDLPEQIDRILQKMMAKDPNHRYFDPGELIDELMLLIDQVGLQPVSPNGNAEPSKPASKATFFPRHLPWLASIAALVCIVIGLDVFWKTSGPRDQIPVTTTINQKEIVDETPDSIPALTGSSKKPPFAETPANQAGLLVVSDLAAGDKEFTSLAAAFAAARNGDVIELRYNGRREEKSVRAANLRATIRAAEGYRPIIVFRPNETDPVKNPRSMFSLNSGRLTITNMAVEFFVPREVPAEKWTLFEIRGGQTIRLEKCSLTISNASDQMTAYHQNAACFRAVSSPGAEGAVASGNSGAPPLATVEMIDSIFRGEAAFIRIEDLQAVHLAWDNGLLLTTEQLLSCTGFAQSPKPDEMLRIDMRHVTAAARGGLVRLTGSQAAPHQFTVQLNCSDNIIMTSPGASLIEQEVIGPLENARRQIVWNGDHNFYQDINVFWTIRSLGAESASEKLSFEGWRTYWGPSRENQPFSDRFGLINPPGPNISIHVQTPDDYRLDVETIDNPVFGAASDGLDAGMQAERLMDLIAK